MDEQPSAIAQNFTLNLDLNAFSQGLLTHWTGNVSWRSMVWRRRLPQRLMKPF
jgi:hypothetical protein